MDYSRREVLWMAGGLLACCMVPGESQAQYASSRVITLFQGATDSAVALGVLPVAVVDSWTEKPTYRYLRQALHGVPHVGLETQPSLEDIALLRPTLIVASRFRHQAVAPLMQQLAPLVMLDEVYEFKLTLQKMAQALNRTQQAERLLNNWRQRIGTLRSQLYERFSEHWPPTVSVLEIREDHVRSYLPASFAGSVLSELGFAWNKTARSAAGVSLKLTNKESLPVVDADIFFVMLRAERPVIAEYYHQLREHPLWRRMQAPAHNQVWLVDGIAWSLSGGILGANMMLDDIERQLIQGTTTV
ncbi:Achromobactin-binding periplasmic protein [Xenorhabdus doucetiae]|uniref:Achromobactin-binding periplasmic protein n=3 Tax=Xenorhabdus doucetiae TaxID=351671 RepID=A0A068QRR1_9GAMM|nr:Achromobactin-binding periplasmic protein [Xenorhabdus doucetiae]